jgi:spore germination protein YaaH
LVDAARAAGTRVLPSIVDGLGKGEMAALLADPAQRALHVQTITELVTREGFDGIDLDYEGFAFSDGRASWPTTQPNWRAFIFELAGALGPKTLSVTVPPVWTSGGAVTGYTVYDPQWLATYADRVRFMVYDWSVSTPGAISPMSWLNSVIAYTNSIITDPGQRQKLQLGVPAYGRDWGRQANAKETCPDGALTRKSIELQKMAAWAASHGGTPIADPGGSGEMYFTYDAVVSGLRSAPIPAPTFVPPPTRANTVAPATGNTDGLQPALRLTPPDQQVTCTVRHFVYYPNEYSIQAHAQAALNAGWSGIVLWALGYEIPEVYYRLGEI